MSTRAANVPVVIRNYVTSNIPYPVALIGCRASPGASLDCCEYDLAVFAGDQRCSQVLKVADFDIEVLYFPELQNHNQIGIRIVVLNDGICLKDNNNFTISSTIQSRNSAKYRKTLEVFGRKSMVSSLLHQEKANEVAFSQPTLSAMWLKFSSYYFLQGILAMSGIRPMPLHELEQIRHVKLEGQSNAKGIKAAMECIGVERATRPLIIRSMKGIIELYSDRYDKDLVLSKIKHLLGNGALPDCYYYIGRIASLRLAGMTKLFYSDYARLIRIAMDLTSDLHSMEKLRGDIFNAAKNALKPTTKIRTD